MAIKVADSSIADVAKLSLANCFAFFEKIKLDARDVKIAAQVLREIKARLEFLLAVVSTT